MNIEDIGTYVAAAAAIVGALWGIFKIVATLTPTSKDDEFVEKFDPVVTKLTAEDEDGDTPAS